MVGRTKPLRATIEEGGPIVRFVMRAFETSDRINELLALFDGPQENVARRVAYCTTADGHSFREPGAWNKRRNIELRINIETDLRSCL
jgi:hypothetical protein